MGEFENIKAKARLNQQSDYLDQHGACAGEM